MRPELPDILRSYARDMDVAGPQYATMAATLREAADELSPEGVDVSPVPVPVIEFDGDGHPGFRTCINCADE